LVEEPKGKRFPPRTEVRHPKYGEGLVYQREGRVKTPDYGTIPSLWLKKLIEKYAQLEKLALSYSS